MEGVMELEMTKEWMADQLEELDLWRKGIYIHPDHQVKVPVTHEDDMVTPVSLGDPETRNAAGSLAAENPRSYGVQDSVDQNLLKELGIPSNLANDLKCDEDFLRSVGAGSCGGGGSAVAGGVNAIKQEKPTDGGMSVLQNNAHLNGRMANQQDSHSVNPLQAATSPGAIGQSQNALHSQNQQSLTWGMYIPNLHQQGALIRQDNVPKVSDAIKTPKVATPQTPLPFHPTPHLQFPNATNGNHLIGKYYQGIASTAGTPQAPSPVNAVPSNAEHGRQKVFVAIAAPVVPAPFPAQNHQFQLPNINDGNPIENYHQFIDDASQTPQASPPVQAHLHHTQFSSANNIRPTGTYLRGPVANVRLTFPNNDDAAAQIRRYQKLLEEDAEKFLKMTENHE
ncbi:hypothetical protein CAEBREN_22716 [Caenorhabditis brenneri]|uniref:Uncharacterized protein n=1 Tax=Caenorhabditis brenneri TaxID=135651 RepID=G0MMT7_CAEBE|nr:hypothetical protein CAEBREN_22716 [Caenorhabditis brenneri]